MGVPPVKSTRVSQDFGDNLTQYNSGAGHSGRDYPVPAGTPVVATEDGVVVLAGDSAYFPGAPDASATHADYVSRLYFLKGGGGNVVAIAHGLYTSTVSHLEKILVVTGQNVKKGEVIGLSGYTGYVVPEGPRGAHVHFEILPHPYKWDNGGYYGRVHPAPYTTEPYFQINHTPKGPHVSKTYTHVTKYSTPWVQPRSFWGYPEKPTGIAIHHWGNDGQKKEDVAWYLSDPSRNPATATSAHTVIEDGWIATLAPPEVGTFHSGSALGNGALVGVEMRPEMTKGDIDTLVQYVYEMEQVYGDMDLYFHQELFATACPGRYVKVRDDIIARVNAMHANGGIDPKLKTAKKAEPAAPAKTTVTPQSTAPAKPKEKSVSEENPTGWNVWRYLNPKVEDRDAYAILRDTNAKTTEILEILKNQEK